MQAGRIMTWAGTGTPGHSGDGGPASRAEINNPFVCVFDRAGNCFVAESGANVVRRIEKNGRISTVAGNGTRGYTGDNGPAREAAFNDLVCVAVSNNGDLYIVDRLNRRVRKYDARRKTVETVLGDGTATGDGDNGPGIRASLKEPHDCVFDGRGGLLVADVAACRVRRLDLKTGIVTTFAGTGARTRSGDNGPVDKASFAGTRALAVDKRDGSVFVCEREGNVVRKIDGKTGFVTTIAGTGQKNYTGDNGPALSATFNGPKGLYCDKVGNLFIADTENHAIRRVDAKTALIITVAGGHKGSDGDNGPADKAGLNRPHGVCVDPDGALYIADSENHRIRVVDIGPMRC